MRRFIMIACMSALYLMSAGQSFKGKIFYENTFKSKIPNVPDQRFVSLLGARWEYYIKSGHYKEVSNGHMQWEYRIESIAVSCTAMKLDDHFFALPDGIKTAQNTLTH